MKKFTSVIIVLLISLGLNAQIISGTGLKLQEMQKKYSEINQQFSRFDILAKTTFPGPHFKSALFSQKLDSTVNQLFNEESQMWQKDYKDEFLYDQEMRNTIWISKEWKLTAHAWDNDSKIELTYNGNEQVSSVLFYYGDTLTDMYVVGDRFNHYYNPDGMTDSTLTWSTEDAGVHWDLLGKQWYHYNASKKLIRIDIWNYDEDEGALVLASKKDISYNGTGKIKTSISSNFFEGEEFPYSKSEYGYDGSGMLSFIEYYSLNFLTLALEKDSRDMYQYNTNGDVSTQIYSTWSGTDWIDEDKDEFEYTPANLSDVAFPTFFALIGEEDGSNELKFSKAISKINTYEMSGGTWNHTDINTFYYSEASATGIDGFANAGFKFYPNPASETVTFNWKENGSPLLFKLYQVTGAQVLEQNTWPGKEVSITHLVNGVYIFRLMNGQQIVFSGKLVKR